MIDVTLYIRPSRPLANLAIYNILQSLFALNKSWIPSSFRLQVTTGTVTRAATGEATGEPAGAATGAAGAATWAATWRQQQ